MSRNQEKVSAGGIIILILVMLNVIILKTAFIHDAQIYWGLTITLPLLLIAIFDTLKKKYAIRSELRQFAQTELEAQREHEQDHPQLRQRLDDLSIGHDRDRHVRPDDEPS